MMWYSDCNQVVESEEVLTGWHGVVGDGVVAGAADDVGGIGLVSGVVAVVVVVVAGAAAVAVVVDQQVVAHECFQLH